MISLSRRVRAEVCRKRGWVALVAITTDAAVPRTFGDNQGVRPVVLAVTRDPHRLVQEINGEQLVHDASAWREWWAKDEAKVNELKDHTEALLWQQGIGRVRDGKKAWDVDLGLLELCVLKAAEEDGIALAKPEIVEADLAAAIETGLATVKARQRHAGA